ALNIRVTRELQQATLVIEIRGTARKPELALSSEPPVYDQTQIVGLILSGDPSAARVPSGTIDSQIFGALSGALVAQIKNQIAPGLPIDVLSVETPVEGGTSNTTRIEVGKYLTSNIYVSYVH